MRVKLFVGNLSWGTNDASLAEAFGQYGQVAEAVVIVDRETGRSKGFGFVTMDNDDEGRAAKTALDGADLDGRQIRVDEARPSERRSGPRY
jgi:RNA recognition motif-containing protein